MEIKFEFAGHYFTLKVGARTILLVDGNLQADFAAVVSGPVPKSEWPAHIKEARRDLRRCIDCGRAKKSDLKHAHEMLRIFEDAYEHELTGEPLSLRPPLI